MLVVLGLSLFSTPTQAPTIPQSEGNLVVLQKNSLVGSKLPFMPEVSSYGQLTAFSATLEVGLAADKYGIDEMRFIKLIQCESGFNEKAIGDKGKAFGLLQFHRPTFDLYCQGEYTNSKDQIRCAAKMISQNLGSIHWTCWNKI